MKAKFLACGLFFTAIVSAGLALSSCGPKDGWTEAERRIISETLAGTDSTGSRILRVLTVDNPEDSLVLRTPCKDFTPEMLDTPEYTALASLMISTVTDPSEDGVGIAGPQVGISRRIVAVQRFDKPGEPFEVYPDIRITAVRGDTEPGPEGCLSVPGLRGEVMRYRDIDITYATAREGSGASETVTERIQGFTAVIFQHECDHLDGILYTDKAISVSQR